MAFCELCEQLTAQGAESLFESWLLYSWGMPWIEIPTKHFSIFLSFPSFRWVNTFGISCGNLFLLPSPQLSRGKWMCSSFFYNISNNLMSDFRLIRKLCASLLLFRFAILENEECMFSFLINISCIQCQIVIVLLYLHLLEIHIFRKNLACELYAVWPHPEL